MGLLEVLEWKLPVRPRTLVLVNLSAFVCVCTKPRSHLTPNVWVPCCTNLAVF